VSSQISYQHLKEDSLTHRRDRGQSLFDLALVLPLLVVLLAGLVEVVFYARTYLAMLEATRGGARFGQDEGG